jgi:hypothetical protein
MGIIAGVAFGIAFSQVVYSVVQSLDYLLPCLLLRFPSLSSRFSAWLPVPLGKADRWGQTSLLVSPQVICLLIFLFQLK